MRINYKYGSPYEKKMIDKAIKEYATSRSAVRLVESYLKLSLEVLHTEFGFGDKRLNQYKKAVEENLDCILEGYVDWDDIIGNIKMVEK